MKAKGPFAIEEKFHETVVYYRGEILYKRWRRQGYSKMFGKWGQTFDFQETSSEQ